MSPVGDLGRFGISAPPRGLSPVAPRGFDLRLLAGLTVYDLLLSFVAALPVREVVKTLVGNDPGGETALLADGAYRLAHAVLFRPWPARALITSLAIFLGLALLAAPFVSGIVMGRVAFSDEEERRPGALGPLTDLATRHYHRQGLIYVGAFAAQALLVALFALLAVPLAALGANDRARFIIEVSVMALGVGAALLLGVLSELVRLVSIAEGAFIARAISLTLELVRGHRRAFLAFLLVRGAAQVGGVLALSLVSRESSGVAMFFTGEASLLLRTAVCVSTLQLAARIVRGARPR